MSTWCRCDVFGSDTGSGRCCWLMIDWWLMGWWVFWFCRQCPRSFAGPPREWSPAVWLWPISSLNWLVIRAKTPIQVRVRTRKNTFTIYLYDYCLLIFVHRWSKHETEYCTVTVQYIHSSYNRLNAYHWQMFRTYIFAVVFCRSSSKWPGSFSCTNESEGSQKKTKREKLQHKYQ
jgi:hypothetical protein